MYFVAGITGHVGGAAAQKLLDLGHSVRTIARDHAKAAVWAETGVEVLTGDFNDIDSLTAALDGVDGAFLMVPPILTQGREFPKTKAILENYREALGRSALSKLVLLSSMGSEQANGLGLITATHLMEEALGELPMPTAFVRAGGFLENYANTLPTAKATGISYSFYQDLDRPIPMVATEDIGKLIAELMIDKWEGKRVIELGSPVSPNALAQAIGEAIGRPVVAQAVPREHWATTLQTFGMPAESLDLYVEMIDGFNSGWIHFGVPGTERVVATITPTQFFARINSAQKSA